MVRVTLILAALAAPALGGPTLTEFCLDGHLDLGVRHQGLRPQPGEAVETTWCVITDDETNRVQFSSSTKPNPDTESEWTVGYLPPDLVRIVRRDSPPDIEFAGAEMADEAKRVRRLDPRRLAEELLRGPVEGVSAETRDRRLRRVKMTADLPLRGRVEVVWDWDWADTTAPKAQLSVDGQLLLTAVGRWRTLGEHEADQLWRRTEGAEAIQVPGEVWPSQIDMALDGIAEGVWIVRGVRSGFQHLVVDTDDGLVVADAPAGWVEFHHLPPSDLVPGLGVSGLSEKLVDFLQSQLPDRPIHAVAITHFHNDHSGGARAFAAAGARVLAPAGSAEFLQAALNRQPTPTDRLGDAQLEVVPVEERMTVGAGDNVVTLMPIDDSPHTEASLGVLVEDKGYFFVSDLHVPGGEEPAPDAARATPECWFARWAVEHLNDQVRVVNSHSTAETPVSRLRQYLESDPCSPL